MFWSFCESISKLDIFGHLGHNTALIFTHLQCFEKAKAELLARLEEDDPASIWISLDGWYL